MEYRGRRRSLAGGFERLWGAGTLVGLDDTALLERYAEAADEDAFEALVARHGPMILGICRRVLVDPRDVEDAFQAVFLILARKARGIRDGRRLSCWLYGVACKVSARARTQAVRRRSREGAAADVTLFADPGETVVDDVGPILDFELNRLPLRYRQPLLLCYLKGRTHDQAARELDCPVGTVRSRLARGREILRRRLTARGVAPAIVPAGDALPPLPLIEPVAASLLSRTVTAAVQYASTQTAPAAAGAVVLAQGVLTTMKVATFKLIGFSALAAGIGVSGAFAGSRLAQSNANGQQQPSKPAAAPATPVAVAPAQPALPTPAAPLAPAAPPTPATPLAPAAPVAPAAPDEHNIVTTDQRLHALETKLDELLRLLRAAQPPFAQPSVLPAPSAPALVPVAGQPAQPNGLAVEPEPAQAPPLGVPAAVPVQAQPPLADAVVPPRPHPEDPFANRPAMFVPANQPQPAQPGKPISPAGVEENPSGPRQAPRPAASETSISAGFPVVSNREIYALEARLKFEREQDARLAELFKRKAISQGVLDQEHGKLLITVATLCGIKDDLLEESEATSGRIKQGKAELARLKAERDFASSRVARYKRLNGQNPGVVSEEQLRKDESLLRVSEAQYETGQAKLEGLMQHQARVSRKLAVVDLALRNSTTDQDLKPAGAQAEPPPDVPSRSATEKP